MTKVFDDHSCTLGEGPLWHPLREQLFWFDILNHELKTRDAHGHTQTWQFDVCVSCAGWLDHDHLIIASEKGLLHFNIVDGSHHLICAVEEHNANTRSNDGRADPWGGFWFGTMGKQAEKGAGSFYRYYKGELRMLRDNITITNSLSFSPDKGYAFFADTAQGTIWRQKLNQDDGWPVDSPEIFLDMRQLGLNPDGAVCDYSGNLWVACWGAHKVCGFDATGHPIGEYSVSASQVSCPAFGGPTFDQLYITTAAQGLSDEQIACEQAGKTFCVVSQHQGLPEYQVVL